MPRLFALLARVRVEVCYWMRDLLLPVCLSVCLSVCFGVTEERAGRGRFFMMEKVVIYHFLPLVMIMAG